MTNLTVSLELAKKMKELWWEKETFFAYQPETHRIEVWPQTWDEELHFIEGSLLRLSNPVRKLPHRKFVTSFAPTAQEVLDELPWKLTDYEYLNFEFHSGWTGIGWEKIWKVGYLNSPQWLRNKLTTQEWANLAEGLWQLWCWCKENWYLPK